MFLIRFFATFLSRVSKWRPTTGTLAGHPDKIKCHDNCCNMEENLMMQGRVRSCHETINGRLKHWRILSLVFRHNILRQAQSTQLMIENGEPLFEMT